MESVSNILFALSSGLLFPVIVVLLALFLYALVHCVTSFVDYNRFVAGRKAAQPLLDGMNTANMKQSVAELEKSPVAFFASAVKLLAANEDCPAARHRYLANMEVSVDKHLSRSRLLVKLGPMTGLMGTLIPMGPALTGLASGNIASMAYNMEVAFATTVLGILIAAIGLVTLQCAKRMYARMLNDLEFINELMESDGTTK